MVRGSDGSDRDLNGCRAVLKAFVVAGRFEKGFCWYGAGCWGKQKGPAGWAGPLKKGFFRRGWLLPLLLVAEDLVQLGLGLGLLVDSFDFFLALLAYLMLKFAQHLIENV